MFQVETKKTNVTNLESVVEDLKKRSANQLDEINRLEDQLRNLNIEQTSMQSKIDTLSLNVSCYVTVHICNFFLNLNSRKGKTAKCGLQI